MPRKHPFTIEEFEAIYSKVPRLCVDLVIKNKNGTLLTLREAHGWLGQWHLPGGTIYIGDTVIDTLHRVAREELNIEVMVDRLLGYIEYPSEKVERGYGYSISLVFLCHPLSEQITLDNLVSEYGFFAELPGNTISEQKTFLSNLP